MHRSAFQPIALVGGSVILSTYAVFAALILTPLGQAFPRAAAAADVARGGILDAENKWLTRIWLLSTTISAGTLGTGLVLLAFDETTNYSADWNFTNSSAIGFFISASLWVPTALAVALDPRWWVRALAALPVWSTAVFNLLLALSTMEETYMFVLLVIAVAHHTLLDGAWWVYRVVYMPSTPPSRPTTRSVALPALVM
jgi:hypothetical protein